MFTDLNCVSLSEAKGNIIFIYSDVRNVLTSGLHYLARDE